MTKRKAKDMIFGIYAFKKVAPNPHNQTVSSINNSTLHPINC